MQIYTATCAGDKLEKVKHYGLGIMISPSPNFLPRKAFVEEHEGVVVNKVPCALDNGAFQAYKKGYPFQESLFLQTIENCYALSITLDFIVCPDIVGGGRRSLEFSLEWTERKLRGTPRLALVVQNDGITKESPLQLRQDMTPEMLSQYDLTAFSHLFIGGSVEWKWQTADSWVRFAHEIGKKCHIGQVGQLRYLKFSDHIKADSVDSTSLVRNGSWHIVEEYESKKTLFKEDAA